MIGKKSILVLHAVTFFFSDFFNRKMHTHVVELIYNKTSVSGIAPYVHYSRPAYKISREGRRHYSLGKVWKQQRRTKINSFKFQIQSFTSAQVKWSWHQGIRATTDQPTVVALSPTPLYSVHRYNQLHFIVRP